MISTRDLAGLPDVAALRTLTKALAMLDAIIEPEWEYRYFSFDAKWDADANEEMASMRNGQGDEWFCLFSSAGAALKGFDHESVMSPWTKRPPAVWPGVLDSVPNVFASFLHEPAFDLENTTFCIWRSLADESWQTGQITFPKTHDPDGSEWMLSMLDGDPSTYGALAEPYYERTIDRSAIAAIYRHQPLTPSLLTQLASPRSLAEISVEASQIGYPLG